MKPKANSAKRASAVIVLCAWAALGSPAQTFTIFSFDRTDGAHSFAGLVQATDGDLYGTTSQGGAYDVGTVFKITQAGALTTLYSFCSLANCVDGEGPYAGLVQATNGDLYGATWAGGTNGGGTVFKMTPAGVPTTLYSFCSLPDCADGANPYARLVQATNGHLYGTTYYGGAHNGGTVFRITPSGALITLYSFCSLANCADGANPYAGLVQAANGDLYGTTYYGGANNYGTVFKITPSGAVTTLYSFCSLADCADGALPYAGLVQASNGDLYGSTSSGAQYNGGTVFKITPAGALTTVYSFCSLGGIDCTDGWQPDAAIVQAFSGDLYGSTVGGGAHSGGTIFQITPSGVLTTLYNFCSLAECADGDSPWAGLVQATNSQLYGTTSYGGAYSYGTVFSLSLGFAPFVKTLPAAGHVGSAVKIFGDDLGRATSVTFNGTAAVYTVRSPTLITTTVPAGATSGPIQVVTPSGTLSSNVPFRVLP